MKREYEALSKLIGRNFAVLEDGTAVHLSPRGEIRDMNDRLLMGADEGRMKLYQENKKKEAPELPEGATANQQLVTDGMGAVKWEEKAFYNDRFLTMRLSPKFDTVSGPVYGYFLNGCYVGGGRMSSNAAQLEISRLMGNEYYYEGLVKGKYDKFVFYLDGVRGEIPKRRVPSNLYPGDLFPDVMIRIYQYGPDVYFEVLYDDGKDHIFQFELAEPVIKPLPPEYLIGAELTEEDNGKILGVSEGKLGLVDPMVIASSTEGSTKKYRITVDDSGTLTATEVAE